MKVLTNWLIFLSLTLYLCSMNVEYLAADVKFGNTQSSIYLNDNGTLEVDSNNFVVNGGQINQSDTGSITGNEFSFYRGTLASFLSSSFFTGYYEPYIDPAVLPYYDSSTLHYGTLKLTYNPVYFDFIISNPGGLRYMLYVESGEQFLRGQPLFFGANDIVLEPASELQIAVQNTLNTNIVLNGGYLSLQDDLRLGSENIIRNGGVVFFNACRFSLGGGASSIWDGIIDWVGAFDMQLNNQTTVKGDWVFYGDAQINGNGNVLDISHGGNIYIAPNSTLSLSSVVLTGLGAGGFFMLDDTSNLVLSDVEIEMDNDFTFDSGNVYVIGDSNVITKNYFLKFAENTILGTKGTLTVNGVAFTYDPLGYSDKQNVQPTAEQDPTHEFVNILDNGSVRTLRVESISFATLANGSQAPNASLQRYIILWPARPMTIYAGYNEITHEFIYDFTVNGNAQFLGFTSSETPLLTVKEDVHVTFENILFRDFSPNHLKFEPNSSLVFGNNSQIRVWENDTLNYPWVFQGNTKIFGAGAIITLGDKGEIVLKGNNSTLSIEGITIKGIKGTNIRCESDTSKIIFQDATLVQSGNYTFGKGSFQVLNNVTLMGPGYNFNFATDKACTINSDSDMQFMWGITLNYLSKNTNLLQMVDSTSVLSFNTSNLSAPNGIQLTRGRLIIQGDCYSYNSTSGAIIFGNNTVAGNLLFDRTLMFQQQSGKFIDETVGAGNGGGGGGGGGNNSGC